MLKKKKYGHLTIVKQVGERCNQPLWECKCSCGAIKNVIEQSLNKGSSNSCGCRTGINHVGKKYNSWKVLACLGTLDQGNGHHNQRMYQCRCKCGAIKIMALPHILSTKQCQACYAKSHHGVNRENVKKMMERKIPAITIAEELGISRQRVSQIVKALRDDGLL